MGCCGPVIRKVCLSRLIVIRVHLKTGSMAAESVVSGDRL
jgi:hypothetical protein